MGIFDIIGPIMIGPSSSHTAGAARIGQLARLILNDELTAADITLYWIFCQNRPGTWYRQSTGGWSYGVWSGQHCNPECY